LAIVSVADRAAVEPFAATENDTVPFPLPGDPPVTVAQATSKDAVHVQVPVAETVTVPAAPLARIDIAFGAAV
jgi:hypothetical protein